MQNRSLPREPGSSNPGDPGSRRSSNPGDDVDEEKLRTLWCGGISDKVRGQYSFKTEDSCKNKANVTSSFFLLLKEIYKG